MKSFNDLRLINVSEHIEKKGGFNYLSWVYAVDTLLQNDPTATWNFTETKYFGDTAMVFCEVTALGKTMKMQLPVMDNRNNSVKNPDSRKISDAMMRCLVKCIACFGVGLYIYAGEDLPDDSDYNNPIVTGDISKWIIPIGTNKGKTLESVGYDKLLSAINYFMDQEKKTGKKIDGLALEYLTNAQNYINDLDSNEFNQTKFK